MAKNRGEGLKEGKFLEAAVLGEVARQYEYDFPQEGKEKYEDAPIESLVCLVKRYQPPENQDPGRPSRAFPKELVDYAGYLLGLPPESRQLRFYTAVNSHLDRGKKGERAGFDAFLEYDLGNGECARCRIDISSDERKITREEGVSDWGNKIVFFWPPEGIDQKEKEGRSDWKKQVERVSETVQRRLESEILRVGGVQAALSEFELAESERIAKERQDTAVKKLKREGAAGAA